MPRRSPGRLLILLALFVVVSVGLIGLDRQGLLDPVRRPLEAVSGPVTGAFGSLAGGRGPAGGPEMATVVAERDYYRAEAVRLQNAESENTQLREQLGIEQKYVDFDVVPAAVLARDPSNGQKFITIDRGSDDGVAVGQAVVDPNNYVGQVTEVGPTQARVTLLIDTEASPLSVEIVDGGDGMLYGMWQAGGRAEMRYVDFDADPQPGDAVLTSSDGVTQSRGVPGGLLVGTVGTGIQSDPLSDDITVPVVPNADLDGLEVVTVILGPKPGTDATSVEPASAGPSASGDAGDAAASAPVSASDAPEGDTGSEGESVADPSADPSAATDDETGQAGVADPSDGPEGAVGMRDDGVTGDIAVAGDIGGSDGSAAGSGSGEVAA